MPTKDSVERPIKGPKPASKSSKPASKSSKPTSKTAKPASSSKAAGMDKPSSASKKNAASTAGNEEAIDKETLPAEEAAKPEPEHARTSEGAPAEKKRGGKRAHQDLSDVEMDDAATQLPDIKSARRGAGARGRGRASLEPSSDVDEGRPVAKRPRRRTTPLVGPLNALPLPIDPVHASDVSEGIAVQVSHGALPTTNRGDVLLRKLFVWGSGDCGQLGLGPTDAANPNKLTKAKPFGSKVISQMIDAGALGHGGVEVIAAGGMHSVLIDAKGSMLTTGSDDYGTLGRKHRGPADEAEDAYYSFAPVEGISPTGRGIVPGDDGGAEGDVERYRATRVASGDAVSVSLDDRGRLRSWGHFKDGEGAVCFSDSDADGCNREQWHPIPVPGTEHVQFAQVACGENHVLALTLDGQVLSWGVNVCSQLGRAANLRKASTKFTKREAPKDCLLTPAPIPGLSDCKAIFAGLSNGFAVTKSGKILAWGLNTKGQTGTGLKAPKVATPHAIAALSPARHDGAQVVSIVSGNFHTAFLLSNGEVYTCGDSDEGKLGLPSSHPALKDATASQPVVVREPQLVAFPDPPAWAPESAKTADGKTKIVALSAGMRFTLALAADGTLYSWGTTSDDAMGQPAEEEGGDQSKDTPTAVAMPGQAGAWRIMAAATAGQHSLALAVKPPQEDD
ncbi:uncharacterized protein PFL1_06090 [Pseudozyma flocculosa PF-1]|uniref:RCC1-like domain-containing protein n=1 Tax=Pseudozyma flocculosa PF-1 TaxID=1277687 RepID=A0A061H1G1_9BASI|nr:uncharacterized protein PFL1_06090 [Pseudozyma flocculosa PF-1]EPQ26442.1 hypothetical protein PFL1_06090 [Pseudozyma flocculosa PF-1]